MGGTSFNKELQHLEPLSETSLKERGSGQSSEQSMWLFLLGGKMLDDQLYINSWAVCDQWFG